jgi:hypothetical protein
MVLLMMNFHSPCDAHRLLNHLLIFCASTIRLNRCMFCQASNESCVEPGVSFITGKEMEGENNEAKSRKEKTFIGKLLSLFCGNSLWFYVMRGVFGGYVMLVNVFHRFPHYVSIQI